MTVTTVILAAGQGTRMRSELPKVLHRLSGWPLVEYSLRLAAALSPESPVVVVGYGADAVRQVVGERARFAVQVRQLGTAHALLSAESLLAGEADLVLVISADMPLFTPETLRRLVDTQAANPGPMTLLTVVQDDSHGFGRIVRSAAGAVKSIVEEAHATPEQLAIKEVNVGAYCFRGDWLWPVLHRIKISPRGEYYLTDTVGLAVRAGLHVETLLLEDPRQAIGINTRVHLAEAEAILRRRVNQAWMLAGVSIIDPETTYIEPDVHLGQDCVIFPGTTLQGQTDIGPGCEIGPNTLIRDSRLGSHCRVHFSVLEGVTLEDEVRVGPYAHLHQRAYLASRAQVGNFCEVRASYFSPGVIMDHYAYIGDATLGEGVQIGPGVITCNVDGKIDQPTTIGAGAVIGSGTTMVAPVKVGDGARTGAGSVVTRDVPEGTFVKGVPARTVRPKRKRG